MEDEIFLAQTSKLRAIVENLLSSDKKWEPVRRRYLHTQCRLQIRLSFLEPLPPR